jgi:hypothetical protein
VPFDVALWDGPVVLLPHLTARHVDFRAAYGLEQIVEAYYSYVLTASTKISVDYQFIANPGYNADRGPVNVFAGRLHAQF